MGLSNTELYSLDCLPEPSEPEYEQFKNELSEKAGCFQVSDQQELPLDYDNLREFFCQRGIGTDGWTSNGLTPDENRQLFNKSQDAKGVEESVKLILRGIKHLEWEKGDRSSKKDIECCKKIAKQIGLLEHKI